jgi:hypothetical protein
MRALGTTDLDFYNGLIGQLLNASKEKEVSESGTNFMLSVIKGIEPRDQTEAMLAAQMAAVQMASMTFARPLAHVETIPRQDSASNAFNKLARAFTAHVEAFKRYAKRRQAEDDRPARPRRRGRSGDRRQCQHSSRGGYHRQERRSDAFIGRNHDFDRSFVRSGRFSVQFSSRTP